LAGKRYDSEVRMLKKVVIACAGSVAVFAIPNLIIVLRRSYGTRIATLMSQSATSFITPFGLSAVAGARTLSPEDEPLSDAELGAHVCDANVFLVAPASANMIAQLASGLGSTLVSRAVLMFDGPIIVAPAMNAQMWAHPSTRSNMAKLEEMGVAVAGPGDGLEIANFEASATALAPIDTLVAKMIEVA
jgi:phosphopantothenoylcysteine decarboxylase/phosphopantothenate--cysteine ligase